MDQNSIQDAIRRFWVYVIDGIYPLLHLLAKFVPLTLYVFVENEVISFWAVSKQSTITELEMDISQNLHFQQHYTYHRITWEQ